MYVCMRVCKRCDLVLRALTCLCSFLFGVCVQDVRKMESETDLKEKVFRIQLRNQVCCVHVCVSCIVFACECML